jgi:hypothetical protein
VRIRCGADQRGDIAASECVDGGSAVAGGADDARTAQYRQLLEEAGWLDVDLGEQVAHRLRPVLERSRTRIRTGWPRIRENSALAWYSGADIGRPFRHCLSFSQ